MAGVMEVSVGEDYQEMHYCSPDVYVFLKCVEVRHLKCCAKNDAKIR